MPNKPPIPPPWPDPLNAKTKPTAQQKGLNCPYCQHHFPLTWKRYLKAGSGHYVCPRCLGKSRLIRRGWYWPIVVVGCLEGSIYFGAVGFRFLGGAAGSLLGVGLGLIFFGVPVDKYAESKYCGLTHED